MTFSLSTDRRVEPGGDLALFPGNEQQDVRKGPLVVPWSI